MSLPSRAVRNMPLSLAQMRHAGNCQRRPSCHQSLHVTVISAAFAAPSSSPSLPRSALVLRQPSSSFATAAAAAAASNTASSNPSATPTYPSSPKRLRPDQIVSQQYANYPVYIYSFAQGVRHIVLNRPSHLNALNLPMIDKLHNIVDALTLDKDISVVAMSGTGNKAFCAGGDVRLLHDAGKRRKEQQGRTGDSDVTKLFFRREYELNFKLSHTRFPVVPVLNGIVMGGGVGLSAHCRYRVATPQSLFAMPETAIGFFPDVGASYLLPRLHHPYLGHYLGLTGARLKGYDLVHAGIATHYADSDDWTSHLELSHNTFGMTWQQGEDAIEDVFWHLSVGSRDPEPAFSLGPEQLQLIADVFSLDSVERIVEALTEKGRTLAGSSSPTAAFVQSTLGALSAASPLSLKVTLEALRRGARMPLADCLKMEYRISQHMMMGDDFYAGVYSQLISKDRKPKWTHARLQDVRDRDVQSYFGELQDQADLQLEYPKFKEPQWYAGIAPNV